MNQNFTIVVPVRNRAEVVGRTLDSIAAQKRKCFRLVVVDNGSTDNTLEFVTKWADAHRTAEMPVTVISELKPGAAAARNAGLAIADTPYVMFFDSDDVMLPSHTERIDAYLTRFPDTDILRWNIGWVDSDGWLTVQDRHFHNPMQLHMMHCTLSTQRYVARAELVRSVGGWNERLSTWDDLELGVRLLAAVEEGRVAKLNGEPTVHVYRVDDDTLTGASFSARAEEQQRALDAIAEAVSSDSDRLLVRARRVILAANYRREGRKDLAESTLAQAKDGVDAKTGLRLSMVYNLQRLAGRGGSALALKFFGSKQEKC